jgi:hypothetical protein
MVGSVPPLQITLLPVNLRHHADSARIDSAATLIHRAACAKVGAVESGQEDGLPPASASAVAGVREGDLRSTPSPAQVARANVTDFTGALSWAEVMDHPAVPAASSRGAITR